ncbi:MAG: SGNH/GDSL hydrolase family protein [Bacillota bacterium]|nr:SGNH/GDSL hydrolase family protein [Bacillota bacterium]
MPINKITIDGITKIDLSTTGIESSADIPTGKYGYLRTGERVLGTGSNTINPLSGKIASFNGDSICHAPDANGGYVAQIGTNNNMTVQNVGMSGGTITNVSGHHCISGSVSDMRSDADYVLFEGGVNDCDLSVPLGTISEGYTATLDDSTFAGAFETMLKSAIARFPTAKIGYIFIHKCYSGFESTDGANSYYGIAKACCEKWGIPYLDLNTIAPPLRYVDSLRTAYTLNGDGIHPNEAGYRLFYTPQITAFMQTMLVDKTLINKTVTINGTYISSDDSADGYSSVTVNVPSSGITPTGSINIMTNGTHDVTNYASAVVSVSGGGTPSATQHTILFEFEDTTTASITAYYDSTFISNAITATVPTTYNNKTVTSAQLDGVTWYEPANIPLNTQLIDYNDVLTGYAINTDGTIVSSEQWNYVTDYTEINSSMTFTFSCSQYSYIGFYDKNKNAIQTVSADNIKDSAEDYFAFGTLDSSNIPMNAAYIVMQGNSYGIEELSLIRTA